jgi:hypothetical protein
LRIPYRPNVGKGESSGAFGTGASGIGIGSNDIGSTGIDTIGNGVVCIGSTGNGPSPPVASKEEIWKSRLPCRIVPPPKHWKNSVGLVLLSEGFSGVEREVQSLLQGKLSRTQRESVVSLQTYLGKHAVRLQYAERLASGRAIGSGLIEGACKNLVGKRLKQTGACWRLSRANRIATLCAALYSDNWKMCWKKYN